MKTNSGFDFLAPFYDLLTRMVFGKSIVQAQLVFLHKIQPDSKILILGGGTGWVLEKLSEGHASCEIWYVDLSFRMIEKARSRKVTNKINFIHGTEAEIPCDIQFDAIITNFYLDLFSDLELKRIVKLITQRLKISSVWIVTDFVDRVWWQTGLLKMMYTFFRVVCRIDATKLPGWELVLRESGWRETGSVYCFSSFIKSSVFIKKPVTLNY